MFVYLHVIVTFSALFKPIWATFTIGSPLNGATYASGQGIIIQVSDGLPFPFATYTASLSCPYGTPNPFGTLYYNIPTYYILDVSLRGQCSMQFSTTGNQISSIGTVNFEIVTSYAVGSIDGSSTVLAGTNFYYAALTIPPPGTPYPFQTTSTFECPQRSLQVAVSVNAGQASLYIPLSVSGVCWLAASQDSQDNFYRSNNLTLIVLNPLYIDVVSGSSTKIGSIVTLLIHTIEYTPVPFILTFSCPLNGVSTSAEITSAANSTDYYYFEMPLYSAGLCFFSESDVPEPYQPTTATINVLPDGALYTFPMERAVRWSWITRKARRQEES